MAAQLSSGDLLADRRYRYAEACLAEGDHAGAADLAEQALEIAPRYAPAWLLLGRAREGLAEAGDDPALRAAAGRAYACALDIDPDDLLGVRTHLVRLGLGGTGSALSPGYVRALFDGYAARFERHLVDGLAYVGPQLLCAALPADPAGFGVALDLGCGTGLMGAAIRDRVGHLAGVDLSPGMLAVARSKTWLGRSKTWLGRSKTRLGRPLYDRLAEGDLTGFLSGEPPASADLCLAADVLIYVADLGPVLDRMARVLRPGGVAAFTVQSPDGTGAAAGAMLGSDGRYAHGDDHVGTAAAAAGLGFVALQPAEVRREGGRPVPGRVVVLRRTAA